MRVNLNGNSYEIKIGTVIQQSPLVEWPDNIRLDGQQQRKDRSDLSSWSIDAWHNGLGLQRINVDLASNDYRLWDVENCDTRFPSQIVLSPAFNTCTITPAAGASLSLLLEYIHNLYFYETNRGGAQGSKSLGYVYQFTPPFTLGSYYLGSLGDTDRRLAISSVGDRILTVYHTTDWDTWTWGYQEGVGSLIQQVGSLRCDGTIFPQIADIGGTIHSLFFNSNRIHMYLHGDNGATVQPVATIPSALGTYLAPLISDGINMYALLPQGLYNFDNTPNLVVDTVNEDLTLTQAMFRQNILLKNKNSLILYDGTEAQSKGYDLEDGLPSDKWGEITAMTANWKWAFAAVKGATYSHILTMDDSYKWQYYARIPTAGIWVNKLLLTDSPDGIDRLWCLFGNYGFPGYFLNPIVNPMQAATYSYVPTGYFTPPIFDGGLAEIPAGFYDTTLIADGMGGSNIMTMLYGLNGANPVSTLGVVATITQSHIYGSPYGLEGYRIQPKIILAGANTGTSPVFRQAITHYLKIPNERLSFQFTIDLEGTARKETRPLENIIGSLNFERSNRLLMPFWYGQIATRNVRVLKAPALEDIEVQDIYEGERTGFIDMMVSEIL